MKNKQWLVDELEEEIVARNYENLLQQNNY